jgi:hypothetical protein
MANFMPLKSAEDCRIWLEKTVNEITENGTSIARANARTNVVKGMMNIYRMALDYSKLIKQGGSVSSVAEFLQIEKKP